MAAVSRRSGDEKKLDFLRRRKAAYMAALAQAPDVLADLKRFCRADTTCFDPDPRIHAALEGRREVWLRIQEHLELQPSELFLKHEGRSYVHPTIEQLENEERDEDEA